MRLSLAGAILLIGTFAQAATRVELVLDEPQPPRTVPWPITTGVPFPKGALTSVENCKLLDNDGQECLLQAKTVATWDGPKGSIRWLTIDFIAQPGKKYALEFGPDVKPKRIASPLQVNQNEQVSVATGALTAEFSTKREQAVGPIRIDRNGDGKIDADEIAATGFEHAYIDSEKRLGSSSKDGEDRKIVVESTGPVRACVRVDGFYTESDGTRIVACRTRYHFFAGLPLVKVVDEFQIFGSTKGRRWKGIAFSVLLNLNRDSWKVAVDESGNPGNQVRAIDMKSYNAMYLFQSTYRHYGNQESMGGVEIEKIIKKEDELRKTDRVGEWMQTGDAKGSVTGSLRWLWQQFPVGWVAIDDRLILNTWSGRGGELDFGLDGIKKFFGEAGDQYLLDWKGVRAPRTPIEKFFYFAGRAAMERGDADGKGIHKHHEFYLHFGRANQVKEGQEYGRLAADPPLALATAKWNVSTDVMGPIAARPNDLPAEAIVDRLFDLGRGMQDSFGDYGWWLFGAGPHYSYQWDPKTQKHYADPRRFEFHTYQRDTQHWWNYLRSGERKFFDWALPSENHWVDIAVAHEPTKFFTEYRGGEVSPATLPWPRGDWAIDSTVHYMRHHDTGEAWLRGQSQFWATYHRTLETTTLAYYLTGDERFNEVIGYWRDYWADLAGKTSASKDLQPWHQSQAWYRPTKEGENTRTWAQMIRDYAPFNSGSRHQQTLFFNLATLYEHTWDPKIGQVVREYADAFLDPKHPIGVWRSQDNSGPVHAEAPIMAHYWVPALWRYSRATNDPRMPEVFRRYFEACLGADPFLEDVGIYSNVQIGYAYAFTKDPRHLRAAASELERLQPNAEPLAKPEDLNVRIYNPYAPIRSFTGVPRLVWALQEGKRNGVEIPPAPLTRPQRTLIAFNKQPGVAMGTALWGYDRDVSLIGPDGKPFKDFEVESKTFASAIQPFDRIQPNHEVFQHRLTIPATAPAGWYAVSNLLETAVLDLRGGSGVLCDASRPIAIHPGVIWYWKVPPGATELHLETGQAKDLRVVGPDDKTIAAKSGPAGFTIPLAESDSGKTIRLSNTGSGVVWFRLKELPFEQSWVASQPDTVGRPTNVKPIATPQTTEDEGRFGKGVLITPQRMLKLPDHFRWDGIRADTFFYLEQGTLEFCVKRLWDDRLMPPTKVSYIVNGPIDATIPWKLPLNEWAHVALVWRPLKKDPKQVILHVYVNGLDQGNYRSTYWEGYSVRPLSLANNAKWLEGFFSKAPTGTSFLLDEVRVSSVPRYFDPEIEFGGQQTINPVHFAPPTKAFRPDQDTILLFHLDGDLKDDPFDGKRKLEGSFEMTEAKKKSK